MQEEIERKIDKILTICVDGRNEREIDKSLTICVEQENEREIDKSLTICVDGVNGESVLAEANFVRVREKSGNFISHSLRDNERLPCSAHCTLFETDSKNNCEYTMLQFLHQRNAQGFHNLLECG